MITRPATFTASAGFVAFAMALALSLHAATGGLLPFDRAVVDELQFVPGGEFYEFFANLMAFGVVEYGVLFGAAAYAWRKGDRMLAVAVVLILVARALNTPLKYLIDRPRPGIDDLVVRDPGEHPGFPSGHSSTVVLVYGYAAVVAMRHAATQIAMATVALALAIVLLIGWDRVYDGAHWPSDVLGGYATGTTLLIVAVAAPPVAMQLWHRLRPSRVGHSEMRGLG